jgi:protein-S-isoprenylcysteine O-methyltransferase Ste14
MDNTHEHARVIVNPFLIYIILGLVAIGLQAILPLPFLAASLARPLGVVILIINMVIGLPAVRSMFAARTSPNPSRPTTALVFSGPYRFTRNPMYIGLTMIYAGLAIFFQLTWGLVLLPGVVWLITRWVIVPEETYLENRFGAQYVSYKSRVGRWF